MKVKIYGITKEMRKGVSKKSGRPWEGYFVSYGYKRDDVNGAQSDSFLLSTEMITSNGNYIPAPGDLCELTYGRGGYIEGIKFINKGEL